MVFKKKTKLHAGKEDKQRNSNSHVQSLKQIPHARVIVSKNVSSIKVSKIIDFSKIFMELRSGYFKTVPLLPPKD